VTPDGADDGGEETLRFAQGDGVCAAAGVAGGESKVTCDAALLPGDVTAGEGFELANLMGHESAAFTGSFPVVFF